MNRLFVIGCLVALVGGCGEASSPPEDTVTGLHLTTSLGLLDNATSANVDVTLTDPIPSRAIYAATLALPDFPPGRTNCPPDVGLSHTIAFTHGESVVATVVLNASGCRGVTISGSPSIRRAVDSAYWTSLAQNLGIRESTLFPSAASP